MKKSLLILILFIFASCTKETSYKITIEKDIYEVEVYQNGTISWTYLTSIVETENVYMVTEKEIKIIVKKYPPEYTQGNYGVKQVVTYIEI